MKMNSVSAAESAAEPAVNTASALLSTLVPDTIAPILRAALLLLVLSLPTLYFGWFIVERLLLRFMFVHLIPPAQLGAPVSLGGLSLRYGYIELRDLRIGNGPGKWKAPFAIQMGRFRIELSLLGFLSLLPGPFLLNDLRFGPLEFSLGFRIRQIDKITVENLVVFLEDAGDDSEAAAVIVREGDLLKPPSSAFGTTVVCRVVLEPTRLRFFDPGDASSAAPPAAATDTAAADVTTPAPHRGTSVCSLKLTSMTRVSEDEIATSAEGATASAFTVISGKQQFTAGCLSVEERDAWMTSIREVIRKHKATRKLSSRSLPSPTDLAAAAGGEEGIAAGEAAAAMEPATTAAGATAAGAAAAGATPARAPDAVVGWPSNARWIQDLIDEADAKKQQRVLQAERRRREWRRQWHQDGRGGEGGRGGHGSGGREGNSRTLSRRQSRLSGDGEELDAADTSGGSTRPRAASAASPLTSPWTPPHEAAPSSRGSPKGPATPSSRRDDDDDDVTFEMSDGLSSSSSSRRDALGIGEDDSLGGQLRALRTALSDLSQTSTAKGFLESVRRLLAEQQRAVLDRRRGFVEQVPRALTPEPSHCHRRCHAPAHGPAHGPDLSLGLGPRPNDPSNYPSSPLPLSGGARP